MSTKAEREPHLIRCQTRDTITPSGVSREGQQSPAFSISQVSTLAASFADDVRAYAAAGADGIGIWELKLGDGPRRRGAGGPRARAASGARSAVPAVPSILPLPLLPGPEDPARARRGAVCLGAAAGARSSAAAVVCLSGPPAVAIRPRRADRRRRPARGRTSRRSAPAFRSRSSRFSARRSRIGRSSTRSARRGELVDEVGSRRRSVSSSTSGTSGTRPTLCEEIALHARPDRRRSRERLARADAQLGRPCPAGRRRCRPARDPRRARRRGWARLLRPRDLLRQRHVRQRVSRLALEARRRRARAPRAGGFHTMLVPSTEGHTAGQPSRSGRARTVHETGRGDRSRRSSSSPLPALVLAATRGAAHTTTAAKKPIIDRLGTRPRAGRWRRSTSPALAAAQFELAKDQRAGRRPSQEARDQDLRHAERQAGRLQVVRRQADLRGRDHHLHRPATSTSRPRRCRTFHQRTAMLTIAPCIGTDQMGPKRFGSTGQLAFSFGNVAQDEGSAMAAVRLQPAAGRRPTSPRTPCIVYFKAVVHRLHGALHPARRQDRRLRRRTGPDVKAVHNVLNARQRAQRRRPIAFVHSITAGAYGARRPFITACARGTTRRSSTRGPATARYWCRRTRRSRTTGS